MRRVHRTIHPPTQARGRSTKSSTSCCTWAASPGPVYFPPDSLRLEFESWDSLPTGAPLPFTLYVNNLTDRPIQALTGGLPGKRGFSIHITTPEGKLVRTSCPVFIEFATSVQIFAPGEVYPIGCSWDQQEREAPLPPGTYQLQAVYPIFPLAAGGEDVILESEPLTLVIVP